MFPVSELLFKGRKGKKLFSKQCETIQNSVWSHEKVELSDKDIEKLKIFDEIIFIKDKKIKAKIKKFYNGFKENDCFEISFKDGKKIRYFEKCVEPYHEIWIKGDWDIVNTFKNLLRRTYIDFDIKE